MSKDIQPDEALVKSLMPDQFPRHFRSWTGNDESGCHHHSAIPLRNSPLYLKLAWKRDSQSHTCFVGNFVLNLELLLASGLVRKESSGHVRLRFFHDIDDTIYIQTKCNEPRLAVGRFTEMD